MKTTNGPNNQSVETRFVYHYSMFSTYLYCTHANIPMLLNQEISTKWLKCANLVPKSKNSTNILKLEQLKKSNVTTYSSLLCN